MNGEIKNRKLRDNGTFDKVNYFVTLKDEDTKKITVLLHEVTEALIGAMKDKNDLFKIIYRNILYTGSFYKGTKVGKPEEFDLDLILKLPVDYNKIEIIEVKNKPGFARIIIPDNSKLPSWIQNQKVLDQWLDENKYFNHAKMRQWFEGIVSKCLTNLEPGENKMKLLPSRKKPSIKYQIKIIKSGPAFTLIVQEKKTEFSVDLVPVLEFNKNPPLKIHNKYFNESFSWHLVPKPSRDGINADLDWRYCFSTYERKILKEYGNFKSVIRQMKKLRDTQGWTIPSYFIETLFFHELASEESKTNYPWSTNSYIEVFIYMLKKFKEACDNRCLNYFWVSNHNLFNSMKSDQIYNIGQRLDKIIKDVEFTPSKLAEYVLTKDEFKQLELKNNKIQVAKNPTINETKDQFLNTTKDAPHQNQACRIF